MCRAKRDTNNYKDRFAIFDIHFTLYSFLFSLKTRNARFFRIFS